MSLEQNSIVKVTVSDILGIQSDLQSLLARMNKWGQQLTQLGVVAQAPQVTATWPPTVEAESTPAIVLGQTLSVTAPTMPIDPTMVDSLQVYYTTKSSQAHQQTVVGVVIANRRQSFYEATHLIPYAGQHKAALAGAAEALQVARKLFPRSMVTIHSTGSHFVKQANGQKPINASFNLWNHFNCIRLTAKEDGIPTAIYELNSCDKNPFRTTSQMLALQAIQELPAPLSRV